MRPAFYQPRNALVVFPHSFTLKPQVVEKFSARVLALPVLNNPLSALLAKIRIGCWMKKKAFAANFSFLTAPAQALAGFDIMLTKG